MKWRWLAIAAGIPVALLFLVIFIILFIPSKDLQGVVARALENAGYTFRAVEFGKVLPLGIEARQLEVGDERGALLRADNAVVRLRLLPLLAGKVTLSFRAGIGRGGINGDYPLLGDGEMHVEINHLRMENIPFFITATGAEVKGDLQAQANFQGRGKGVSGEARLEVKGAELTGVKIGEMPLPDASYDTVRGALKVGNGKAVLESATLQGEGLYARLKGDMPVTTPLGEAPLNLTLELMPKPDFLEQQKFVFLLLGKYLISPGNYRIPIQGVLAKPVIE